MFKHILIPTDGSPTSMMAVTKAAGLANTAHIAGGMDAWKKAGGPVLH